MGVKSPNKGVELEVEIIRSDRALDFGEKNEKTRIHHNNGSHCRRIAARSVGIGRGQAE
jgi:hypothetical protein